MVLRYDIVQVLRFKIIQYLYLYLQLQLYAVGKQVKSKREEEGQKQQNYMDISDISIDDRFKGSTFKQHINFLRVVHEQKKPLPQKEVCCPDLETQTMQVQMKVK
ncbi:Hypothetical_protein [Hexamita inflata]|uniref:Hypothetical_protein n=1 Tax=Hexamita inflata TaxID=28002 RepID=A0ABP1HXY3_9EUKA